MEKNKRFGRSIMGFKKNDVYEHIETLYMQFDEKLRIKDEEIDSLNKQNQSLKEQIDKIKDKFEGIEDYKSNIADVLLNAKEQGKEIIKNAQQEGENIKNEIEQYVIKENEKLNIFREEMIGLKNNTNDLLQKYKNEIEELLETTLKHD